MKKLCIFFVAVMLCATLCFSAFADIVTPGLPSIGGGGTSSLSVIIAAILAALSFIYMWFHRKK